MLSDITTIIGNIIWFFIESALYMFFYPVMFIRSLFGSDDPSFMDVIHAFPVFLMRFFSLLTLYVLVLYVRDPRRTRETALRLFARIHFLVTPHPATELLKQTDMDDPHDINEAAKFFTEIPVEPPPIYKSENMGKKSEASTERYRKEKEQLDAWIELQETKARAEEYKKHRPNRS